MNCTKDGIAFPRGKNSKSKNTFFTVVSSTNLVIKNSSEWFPSSVASFNINVKSVAFLSSLNNSSLM